MRTYIAGHKGMVGSAIAARMGGKIISATHSELDLQRQADVEKFFDKERPEIVILAAAKVGGIYANNTYRADFIYNNLQIQNNVIHSAYKFGVKKLLFLGSSCIYPRMAPQPIKEESLLTGELEPTNEAYACAKIAGIKMCENYFRQYGCNFVSVMPTNLYGENDSFDLQNAHVLPALLRRFHEAKKNNQPEISIWGTGEAKREFMHVDDMSDACLYVLKYLEAQDLFDRGISHINIGTGKDISIKELAEKIAKTVGYSGRIVFDTSKPDGTPRKLLDVSRLSNLGWKAQIGLDDGLESTYKWYCQKYA